MKLFFSKGREVQCQLKKKKEREKRTERESLPNGVVEKQRDVCG